MTKPTICGSTRAMNLTPLSVVETPWTDWKKMGR